MIGITQTRSMRWRVLCAGALLALIGAVTAAAQPFPGDQQEEEEASGDAGQADELVPPRLDDQPVLWRIDPDRPAPELPGRDNIRILTGNDFPPFNYVSTEGSLVGFNVELAHALCTSLRVTCVIAAKPWEELVPALLSGEADAIIASMKVTEEALDNLDFTKPYFRSVARFAVRKPAKLSRAEPLALAGQRVGVLRGTAHEAYLGDFFNRSVIRLFDDRSEARTALKEGRLDALFGDGLALSFWVLGSEADDCCMMVGGTYTEPHYFGDGVAMAVRRGDAPLRIALNRALDRAKLSGTYDRILRKYVPLSLF